MDNEVFALWPLAGEYWIQNRKSNISTAPKFSRKRFAYPILFSLLRSLRILTDPIGIKIEVLFLQGNSVVLSACKQRKVFYQPFSEPNRNPKPERLLSPSIETASLNLRNPETYLSSGNGRSGQDGAHLGPETVLPRLQTHAEAHGGTAAASHRRGRPVCQFRHRFARPDILCVGENGRCELSGILPFVKLFSAD